MFRTVLVEVVVNGEHRGSPTRITRITIGEVCIETTIVSTRQRNIERRKIHEVRAYNLFTKVILYSEFTNTDFIFWGPMLVKIITFLRGRENNNQSSSRNFELWVRNFFRHYRPLLVPIQV